MIKEGIKTNVRTLKLAYGGLLVALGILLPQAFHVFGQNAGMIFLPIQIPVLFGGILLGPYYGGVIGSIVPLLSSVLTGMPPVPKVYFMFVELVTYGMVAGWLIRRTNVYVSLLTAMLCGRAAYGLALVAGVQILHMQAPFLTQAAFFSGIVSGIPGMAIQILLLPVLYLTLRRGGLTFE